MAKNPNKIVAKKVMSDYVLDTIFTVVIILVFVMTLYPFLNSLAISTLTCCIATNFTVTP